MFYIIFLLLFIGVAVHYILEAIKKNENYFKSKNLNYWHPNFLKGNALRLFFRRSNSPEFTQEIYCSRPGEKIVGVFDGLVPLYFVRDIEVLKKLVIKDFDHFEDHRAIINAETDRLFGNTLLILKGQKWRHMRATLSPAFTGTKMRQMFELIGECAKGMTDYYKKEADAGRKIKLDVKLNFARITTDVIASCAFGLKTNSFENADNEFYQISTAMSKVFNSFRGIAKLILLRLFPTIMHAFGIEFVDEHIRSFFHKAIIQTITEREKLNIFRPDMVNILMQIRKGTLEKQSDEKTKPGEEAAGFAVVEDYDVTHKGPKKLDWNDYELVAQAFIFFVAGFDTTSAALQYIAYSLAVNPDCQEKLIQEVDEINEQLNGKPLIYDTLPKMKYMDMVVSEVLRLYPPLPVVDRMCVKDYHYKDDDYDFTIKRDEAAIWIPIFGFHYDPQYFPNPNKFDPERFSEENRHKIKPGVYMPFGIGPRNCIASRFALMELKSILFYMLLDFTFAPCEETQIPLKFKNIPFGLQPAKPVILKYVKRNK